MSNYEILIAQNGELSQEEYRTISQVAVEAYSVLLDLQVRLESISESDLPGKDTLIQLVNELLSTIGALQVKANNKSLTKGEGIALAQQIVDLSTILGDKCANLETTARSEEGKAVARSCVVTMLKPQSILGNFDLVKELDDQSTALYSRVNL